MRARLWAAVGVALWLSACGSPSAEQASAYRRAKEAFDAAKTACKGAPGGDPAHKWREYAICVNTARDRYLEPVLLYSDLVALANAGSLVIADKLDNGSITLDEAQLEYQEMNSRINNMATERYSAEQQAKAASMGPPPGPFNTHCYSAGGSTNCTSY